MSELSVVIPTYRRSALLTRCLDSLSTQDLPAESFEVIVVDDGSPPDTERVLRRAERSMSNLRRFRNERNAGPAAARNLAISQARGGLILFMDDDVVATPTLLSTHLRLQRGAADPLLGILGLVEWDPQLTVSPFMRWLDRSGLQFAYETWIEEGPIRPPFSAFYACNISVDRRLLLAAGGFDERFPYPAYEDMELAWRLTLAGFHLVHTPAALAYHARAIDLRQFCARMGKVAESAVLLAGIQPDFPHDSGGPEHWGVSPWTRAALFMTAPIARLTDNRARLERYYRAEIAAAYASGRARGERALGRRLSGEAGRLPPPPEGT